MQQWMASMRHNSAKQLREEQEKFSAQTAIQSERGRFTNRRVNRGGYRNKGLDGIRFLRTYEGDRIPTGTAEPPRNNEAGNSGNSSGKFHTAVPFEYGKRGRFQRGGFTPVNSQSQSW